MPHVCVLALCVCVCVCVCVCITSFGEEDIELTRHASSDRVDSEAYFYTMLPQRRHKLRNVVLGLVSLV